MTVEKHVSGIVVDPQESFFFTLQLKREDGRPADYVDGEFGDLFFEDGTARFTLKDGESKTATNLPAGLSYSVTEDENSNYTTTSVDASGTIEKDTEKTAQFTNTRKTGTLNVSKTVRGEIPPENDTFFFTLTLKYNNQILDTLNLESGALQIQNGQATFELKDGQSITIEGLPVGVEYQVQETEDPDYLTTAIDETGTIGEVPVNAEFNNIYPNRAGSLSISKRVDGQIEPDKAFTFDLEFMHKNKLADWLNGDYTITTPSGSESMLRIQRGKAKVLLKAGETLSIHGLPANITAQVREGSENNYSPLKSLQTAVIPADKTASLEFVNTRLTGGLTISKQTEGNGVSPDEEFSFRLILDDSTINGRFSDVQVKDGQASFTLKAGQSITLEGLPAGVHYIIEELNAQNNGYSVEMTNGEGEIRPGKRVSATVKNTKWTGDLKLTKSVEGKGADKNKEFTFQIELSDSNVNGTYGDVTFTNGKATVNVSASSEKVITGLPENITWTVTEQADEAYHATENTQTGQIERTKTALASFTNRFKTGDLTITKKVEGNADYNGEEFQFSLVLDDQTLSGEYGDVTLKDGKADFTLANGQSKTIRDLPEGVGYEVIETNANANGYTTTATGAVGTIEDQATQTAAFTNAKWTGDLVIHKTVNANKQFMEKSFTFEVTLPGFEGEYDGLNFDRFGKATFELRHNQTRTIRAIPAGTAYTVRELEANQDGYTTSYVNDQGTIGQATTTHAVFTNTKWVGDLKITKAVEGRGADENKRFTFDIKLSDSTISGTYGDVTFTDGRATIELAANEEKTVTGLPEKVNWTVTEREDSAYRANAASQTGTINGDHLSVAAFVNTFKTGNLAVSKSVEGNEEYKNGEFHFSVTLDQQLTGQYGDLTFDKGKAEFTLHDGQSKTIRDLPAGIGYEVIETDANENGYATDATNAKGTIVDEMTINASFTNTKSTGNLTISKTIEGNPEYKADRFNFEVTLPGFNGNFDGLNFVDGKAQFELGDNESRTLHAIPTGTPYEVREIEANQNGYTTSSSNENGTIEEAKTAQASFTNSKWTGNLKITKAVEGKAANEYRRFTFDIELSDPTINGIYGDVSFTNGKAKVQISAREEKTITGLPEHLSWTVTEHEDKSYRSVESTKTGTIERNQTAAASFTNIIRTGNLKISKRVEGNEEYKASEFHFAIILDLRLNGEFGDVTFEDGEATFTLKDGQSKTIRDLPAGTNYHVTETDANTNGYVSSVRGPVGTIAENETRTVSFTNRQSTGDLTISKTIAGNPDYLKDRFTFEVELSGINGEFDGLNFVDGKAQFELGHNEKRTIHAIPNGTVYTVREIEANQNGYTTTSENETGTIQEAKTAQASFTNTKWTGDLKITKGVEGRGADENKRFTFEIELSDPTINGTYGDVTFTNGKATVQISAK